MKKKYILISILLVILTILFTGCNINLSILKKQKQKPSKFYYTQSLVNDFSKTSQYEVNALYLNYYKGLPLNHGEILTLRNFFKNVSDENFIDKPANLPAAPIYKLFCYFDEECKYVIEVYNNQLLCIYPWDGHFEEDYIDMNNSYASYNLMGLCKYIFNKNDQNIIEENP